MTVLWMLYERQQAKREPSSLKAHKHIHCVRGSSVVNMYRKTFT